jgi:hypothetical protein
MATNAYLSPDEKRFLVSLLEGIKLRLNQVSGYMEGVPNGETITRRLQDLGQVLRFPPVTDIDAAVEIVLSYEGKRRAEELRAEGVEAFTRPPTQS